MGQIKNKIFSPVFLGFYTIVFSPLCGHLVFWGFKTTLEEERTQEKAVGESLWGSMKLYSSLRATIVESPLWFGSQMPSSGILLEDSVRMQLEQSVKCTFWYV